MVAHSFAIVNFQMRQSLAQLSLILVKMLELLCAVTSSEVQSVSWLINEDMGPYKLTALLNQWSLTGYSSNGNNLIVHIIMNDVRSEMEVIIIV